MTITVAVCSLPPFNAETWGCDMNIVSGNEHGFTLIEALMALFVLSFGLFAMNAMQVHSVQGNSRAVRLTTASFWNSDQIEKIIGMQYSDASLQDGDGDGTNGLDDMTKETADGYASTSDGRYKIFWNVAVDVPMLNLKTIYVHVQEDNRQVLSRPVTIVYVKDDII